MSKLKIIPFKPSYDEYLDSEPPVHIPDTKFRLHMMYKYLIAWFNPHFSCTIEKIKALLPHAMTLIVNKIRNFAFWDWVKKILIQGKRFDHEKNPQSFDIIMKHYEN